MLFGETYSWNLILKSDTRIIWSHSVKQVHDGHIHNDLFEQTENISSYDDMECNLDRNYSKSG